MRLHCASTMLPRGAGASYGIATEFLYKINREPETLPAAVMVWVDKR